MPRDSNQNITRFIILGLLNTENMSGYDILTHVTKYFQPFTKVSNSSVYYLLDKMEKDGLIRHLQNKNDKDKIHSKKTHSITEKGKKEFENSITEIAQIKLYDPIQLVLIFCDSIDEKKTKEVIQSRLNMYDTIESHIDKTISCTPENVKKKYFNLAMKRGKAMIDTDKKILKDILENKISKKRNDPK